MPRWRSDAPRAVPLRRALPDDARDLAALDPEVIAQESEHAWPLVRDAAELHDALLVLGVLPETPSLWPNWSAPSEEREAWFRFLVEDGLAFRLEQPGDLRAWVAAERLPLVQAMYPEAELNPTPTGSIAAATKLTREDAILSALRGWVECSGPIHYQRDVHNARPHHVRHENSPGSAGG